MSTTTQSIWTRHSILELIDVQDLAEAVDEQWYNQTLCRVNDCVVRLGVMQGTFHWHEHEYEDEYFYVIDGRFMIDLEARSVELTPQESFMVPRGVKHRTRAPERTVILMVEGADVVPTGDDTDQFDGEQETPEIADDGAGVKDKHW
ncbi:cupin domain-containing protein [Halocatena marina]|uniref:Cupin domain-containing protein n=1 Tax=Halocatena marina TaxID=2934937 RepID=A0ABD5YVT5_9EURY